MRVSATGIFTLATLAAANITQQATAVPTKTVIPTAKAGNLVVPVIEDTPTRIETIASPENIVTQQFSQNRAPVPTAVNNNSTVILKPVDKATLKQKDKNNSSVIIPLISSSASSSPPQTPATDNYLVVTATDVQVVGANQQLQQIIRKVIKTQAGGETSQSQLQKDVTAILDTGLFSNVSVNSFSTQAGLNVVYQVQPVIVRFLQLSGAKVLTYQVAQQQLQSQIGTTISPAGLQQAVAQINKWYTDNGYNLARVLSIKPNSQGILTVNVAEGLVSDIKFRFVNDEGKTIDSKGNPVGGRTKPDFLQQQLKLKPGQIFQENIVKQDIQQLYRTGLFETVNVALEGDATKLDLVYQLKETGARGVNLGGSYNADQGLIGTISYQDQNVGGVNDTLGVNVGVSSRDLQFNSKFISPYRITNPDRLGYTVNGFRSQELSETFDDKIKLANGDKIREGQIGGGVSLQQPIDDWNTSLGLNYTRTSIRDRQGNITPTDAQGNPLSASGTGVDDLTTVSFTATKDQR
ncbi:BamA/TamA family outer membrane protein, partial [Nostoc sp. CCCryo 231-06]|nr:BamA/TamA family outer membrane protein [Nostoc sp. CCCryo 231-06]